ncbi:hypothetical protein H1R20_g11085, partial [Candolleomyces eurysporus]
MKLFPGNKTAPVVQENNLHQLQLFGQFSRTNVGVDIENLTLIALRQAGQEGRALA